MPADEVALMQQLHDELALALWRSCLRLVGNDRARAEDSLQETMPRAWRHRAVLESSPTAVRSRLQTEVRNIVTDEWGRHRTHREPPVADVAEGSPRDDAIDHLLLSWVVSEALTRHSPDHRAVLLKSCYRGRQGADAARRLGGRRAPVNKVKSRTQCALRALKLALEELGVSA